MRRNESRYVTRWTTLSVARACDALKEIALAEEPQAALIEALGKIERAVADVAATA